LAYGNIIYDKSPVVLNKLIRKIGEEAFQQGIREYLTK
jgi:aminopeptidase N